MLQSTKWLIFFRDTMTCFIAFTVIVWYSHHYEQVITVSLPRRDSCEFQKGDYLENGYRCFMLKNNCCSFVQMFVRHFPRDVIYTMQTQVCINSCIHVKKLVIGFFYQVLRFQRKTLLLFYWFSPYYSIFLNEIMQRIPQKRFDRFSWNVQD